MTRASRLIVAGILLMVACPAQAHLVTTGMGPVYDGIGHLLLTPEDLLGGLSLSIYAGLRGVCASQRALFLLPAAWVAGGLAGSLAPGAPALPTVGLTLLLLGGLVAADLNLPPRLVALLALGIGFAHGFANGAAAGTSLGTLGLVGIAATLFVLLALGSAFVVSRKAFWARIAARVVGSWVAAIGLLMFGWALR